MRKSIILLLSLIILLLTACRGNNDEPTAAAVPPVEPTAEPTAAPPTAMPTEVDSGRANRDALVAQPWQWISFQGAAESFEIQDSQNYLATFNQDGTVSIRADCNNVAGSYAADESSLTIVIGPATLAACPPGGRGDQFVQFLASAARYFLDGANLRIELMLDGGNMNFAPAAAVPVQPTLAPPPTATPIPPTAVPPTAVPPPPGSVVDSGPRPYANGTYQAPCYTVAAGDTLFSIGQRFGVPYQQIAAANSLVNNAVYAGQILAIPGGGAVNPPAGAQFERVVFAPGNISATLNGIIAQNLPKGYVLGGRSGQVLEIGTTSNGEALEVMAQTADGRFLTLNGENGKVNNNLWLPLLETGDYYVTIRPVTPAENPNLAFTVTFIIQ